MASFCETSISSVEKEMGDDTRGFTSGGNDHVPPDFEFVSSSSSYLRRGTSGAKAQKKTSTKTSRLRAFPIPLSLPVAPEELDLESTIVAPEEAFLSGSDGERPASAGPGGYCSESFGNTTSYSKAVNRGRMESILVCQLVEFSIINATWNNVQKSIMTWLLFYITLNGSHTV